MSDSTGEARRSRPLRKESSKTKTNAPTVPCCFCTSCPAPQAVPPVASRSSRMATFSPGFTASTCASSTPLPYSSAYSIRCVLYGSLPSLRTGEKPIFMRSASAAPKMNPRDSMATMRSNPRPRSRSSSASSTAWNACLSARTGVMSLKRMPGWGKSGTSRIRLRAWSREDMRPSCHPVRKKTAAGPMGGVGTDGREPGLRLSSRDFLTATQTAGKKFIDSLSAQEPERIARMRSEAHFEMQVRPGGVARAAHARDGIAARDAPAGGDEVLRVVRVDGDQIALVRQEHEISVTPLLPREDHHAVGGGSDGRPFRRRQVDAVMLVALARPEAGDEHAVGGPGQRLTVGGGIEWSRAAGAGDLRGTRPARGTRLRAGRRGSVGRRDGQLTLGAPHEEERSFGERRGVREGIFTQELLDRRAISS